MSHHHDLDEYDDATLLRELLLRTDRRAKRQENEEDRQRLMDSIKNKNMLLPMDPQTGALAQVVHLMTPTGDIACGEERPSRGTQDPISATCPKCLHAYEHKSNGAAS